MRKSPASVTATAGAPAPQFTAAPISCKLRFFRPITLADVIKVVQELPDKQCFLDRLTTWLLKANVSLLVPFLCRLFNWSLQRGTVPSSMKSAYVIAILKKQTRTRPTRNHIRRSAIYRCFRSHWNDSCLNSLWRTSEKTIYCQMVNQLTEHIIRRNRCAQSSVRHSACT